MGTGDDYLDGGRYFCCSVLGVKTKRHKTFPILGGVSSAAETDDNPTLSLKVSLRVQDHQGIHTLYKLEGREPLHFEGRSIHAT